jgi:lysophospholipase L1-like esterase
MSEYNEIMREVAEAEGLYYAHEVLEERWTKDDFVDPSHLNAGGNQKFAAALQKAVRASTPSGAHAP